MADSTPEQPEIEPSLDSSEADELRRDRSAEAVHPDLAPLGHLLESLSRAVTSLRFYGWDHPAAIDAASEASEARRGFALGREVQVLVNSDGFRYDGTEVPTSPSRRELAKLLTEHGIGQVLIGEPITATEVVEVSRCLGRRVETGEGVEIADALKAASNGRVQLVKLDYSGLGMSDRTTEHEQQAGNAALTFSLVETLTANAGDEDWGTIGAVIEKDVSHRGSGALDGYRVELAKTLAKRVKSDTQTRAKVDDRLRAFVYSLSPTLRAQLLAFDTKRPELSSHLLNEIADVLPTQTVLTALSSVDSHGLKPNRATLMLMSKLSRLTENDEPSQFRVTSILSEWSKSGRIGRNVSGEQSGHTAAEVLGQLLETNDEKDYNPADYETTLEHLAHNKIQKAMDLAADDLDGLSLASQAAMVALELAATTPRPVSDGSNEPDDVAKCAAFAVRRMEALSKAGRHELLLEANGYMNDPRVMKALGPADAAAAMERSGAPSFVRSLVVAWLESPDAVVGPMIRGFRGDGATEAVKVLAADARPRAKAALRELLVSLPPGDLMSIVESCESLDPRAATSMIQGVCELPDPIAQLFWESLSRHPASSVRLGTFQQLALGNGGLSRDQVSRALRDPDPTVVSFAGEHLVGRGDPEALDSLRGVLEGVVLGRMPEPQVFDAIVEHLIACGEPGVLQVAGALGTLSRSTNMVRAAGALQIVRRLKLVPTETAQAAVRAWRISPSRLVGGLMLGEWR